MSQLGFHGLFGLVMGPPVTRRLGLRGGMRRNFILGYVFGNMLPDADWIPLIMVYLADPDLALTMHRGFTHSLVGAALPTVGFSIASWLARDRSLKALGWGLSLGVLSHIFVDIFVWFSGLDLFWPLSYFGLAHRLNLWEHFYTPPVLRRLLAACEYLAYAVYYGYLEHMVREADRSLRYLPTLRSLRAAMGWLTALYLFLALLLDGLPFYLLQWTIWALVAFPAVLYVTAKLAPVLDSAARPK